MKNRTILVTMDFNQDTGFFLKESLVRRLESLNVSLRPLTYDLSAINRHLQDAAGLIIPGGIGDVDPGLYGEDCHAKTKTIASRSHFEMRLLEKAIHEARAHKGPTLIAAQVDPDEHVYPMVPPGTSLGNQALRDSDLLQDNTHKYDEDALLQGHT